jgi:ABC-type polysaccharide/polyol phosphate export permease
MSLLVFYFIAKIPEVQKMGVPQYAAFVFSGLLPFRFIQRAATESCELLSSNIELLKCASFPLVYLSYSSIAALLVDLFLQCLLMGLLIYIAGVKSTYFLLFLPIFMIFISMLALGISWILSVIGYLLRDMQEIMTIVFGALVYFTPTMYPANSAPGLMKIIINLNPLTHIIIMFRDIVNPLNGEIHLHSWLIVTAFSFIVFVIGYKVVTASQKYVGDLV